MVVMPELSGGKIIRAAAGRRQVADKMEERRCRPQPAEEAAEGRFVKGGKTMTGTVAWP